MPNGLLNVNKPAGTTSRQVVDLVLRLARPCKAGHAGTLDPLATGVLVVGVGAATRLIEHVQRMTKVYVGTFLLGGEARPRTSKARWSSWTIHRFPPASKWRRRPRA